jgi:hypothetical protein
VFRHLSSLRKDGRRIKGLVLARCERPRPEQLVCAGCPVEHEAKAQIEK